MPIMSLSVLRRVDGIMGQLSSQPTSSAGTYSDPTSTRASWLNHNLNTASILHELDYANHEQRAKMRAFFNQPLFVPQYNISVDEERRLALRRLQAVCAQGFFSVKDFHTNPDKIYAAHELLAYVDGACATKLTVQFNLVRRQLYEYDAGPSTKNEINAELTVKNYFFSV